MLANYEKPGQAQAMKFMMPTKVKPQTKTSLINIYYFLLNDSMNWQLHSTGLSNVCIHTTFIHWRTNMHDKTSLHMLQTCFCFSMSSWPLAAIYFILAYCGKQYIYIYIHMPHTANRIYCRIHTAYLFFGTFQNPCQRETSDKSPELLMLILCSRTNVGILWTLSELLRVQGSSLQADLRVAYRPPNHNQHSQRQRQTPKGKWIQQRV